MTSRVGEGGVDGWGGVWLAFALMRRRWPAFLLVLVLGAGGAIAVLVVAGGSLVARFTRARMPELIAATRQGPGQLRQVDFTEVELRPWATVRWAPVVAEALPPPTRRRPEPKPVRIRATEVTARLTGLKPLRAEVRIEGIRVDAAVSLALPEDVPFGSDDFEVPLDRIDAGSIILADIPVTIGPRTVFKAQIQSLRSLLTEGAVARPITLTARLHFRLREIPMSVRLETVRNGDVTQLRINRGDLDVLSDRYYRPLTSTERDLIAISPVRAPVLLRIKDYAERSARRLATTDPVYREDPTRHILWSYWLARTYDAAFAEQVTDSHELGSDNSRQESDRDRSNNRLGRDYAAANKTEGQVVHLIRTDPRVVR